MSPKKKAARKTSKSAKRKSSGRKTVRKPSKTAKKKSAAKSGSPKTSPKAKKAAATTTRKKASARATAKKPARKTAKSAANAAAGAKAPAKAPVKAAGRAAAKSAPKSAAKSTARKGSAPSSKKAAGKPPATTKAAAKKTTTRGSAKTASKGGSTAPPSEATPEATPRRSRAKRVVVTPTGPRHPRLGFKWACFACGAKFYDLGREEPLCPKCGADQRDRPPDEPRSAPVEEEKPKVVRPMAQLLDEEESVEDTTPAPDDDIELDGPGGGMFDDTGEEAPPLDIDDVEDLVDEADLDDL